LYYDGFKTCEYGDKRLSEAHSILEKLTGKISEKKMQIMRAAMTEAENSFEETWLSGYIK
jgi:hypothetical protein